MTCFFDLVQLELMLFKNNVKTFAVVFVSAELAKPQTAVLTPTNVLNKSLDLAAPPLLNHLPFLAQPLTLVMSPPVIQTLLVLLLWEDAPTPLEIVRA